MKIVTEIGFDELIDSGYFDRDGEGAEFVGDIDTMNFGNEFMQVLDRQFDTYPEMSELVGYIETNVSTLADKMGLVAADKEFRNSLSDFRKQVEVALTQCDGESFDILQKINDEAENVYYSISITKYVERSFVEVFVNDSVSGIREIRSLNTFENENYTSLNQVLTNMEQDLDKMTQII